MKRDILLGLMLGLASPALAGQIQQGPADIGVDAPELGRGGLRLSLRSPSSSLRCF